MAKTIPAGSIDIPGVGTFAANAVPDPFDARDLEYRPKLQALPPIVDQRAGQAVLRQAGQSCTGHALAAVINTVLAHPAPPAGRARPIVRAGAKPRVSPYMLYRLARRYDEFPGEADAGSSLRGAFKGWFHHGAALEDEWPRLDMATEPDLDDDRNLAAWRERPLGAFYRVNPYRLDDVQSAITELYGIAVSAVIHDGWARPVIVRKGSALHVIQRPVDARSAGGHAFALVGYNEVGFLVQNSWGTGLGQGWLRDAALRGLVRLRLRRLGGPAGRASHPVLLGPQPDPGGHRRRARHRRRPGPSAAGDARREPGQQRPALAVRQVRQHAGAGEPGAGAHGGLARLLAREGPRPRAPRDALRPRRRRRTSGPASRSPSAS